MKQNKPSVIDFLLDQKHLFAANYVDQARMGDVEVEDWNKLDDYIGMFQKANGLKLQDAQLQKLKKEISEQNSGTSLKTLGQLLNVFKLARDTGITNSDEWLPTIVDVFKANGLPMSKEIILKAGEGTFTQSQELINLLFPLRINAGG